MTIIKSQNLKDSTAFVLADVNYQEDIQQLWKKLVKEQKSDAKILSKEVTT